MPGTSTLQASNDGGGVALRKVEFAFGAAQKQNKKSRARHVSLNDSEGFSNKQ
jgi:hypothetical protein